MGEEAAARQRVKYKHPETGEDHNGHVHATGHKGATVIGQDGSAHQVPHGQYLHHDEDSGPDGEALKETALRHMGHGSHSRMGMLALAALLQLGGVADPTALKGSDLEARESDVLIQPDKLRLHEPPEAVQLLSDMVARAGDGAVFAPSEGGEIRLRDVKEYVDHFSGGGTSSSSEPEPMEKAVRLLPPGVHLVPLEKADVKAHTRRLASGSAYGYVSINGSSLEKAVPSALVLPVFGDPLKTWHQRGVQCEYRESRPGVGWLTLRGGKLLPLPYHEIASSLEKAVVLARRLTRELQLGEMPFKGVFKKDGQQ